MEFKQFRVFNYRNINDSGLIDVNQITAFVGQNEAGKSNLFEALYRVHPFDKNAVYNIEEDWPVDRWGELAGKATSKIKVCEALFELDKDEIESLFLEAEVVVKAEEVEEAEEEGKEEEETPRPETLTLHGIGFYNDTPQFFIEKSSVQASLGDELVNSWAKKHVPNFVYIHDYEMSGAQIELNNLLARKNSTPWDSLTTEEQTMLTVLDLADINLNDFHTKGASPEGRTTRSFDKRSASAFLTSQFQKLWRQKKVRFDIDIDSTTLNIFVEDEAVGMPVRLNRRSTGFRWYVAFAWKFTHASKGQFENCILLLEEPGIHLHYSAQLDLLSVFELLKETNTVLYTTHLASMVDLGSPERIRIVETTKGKHTTVKKGVVSSQKAPMAVIEMSLGLTGNMTGLLGNRKTLIVEGGDDALILNKLSGVLRISGKESLSDTIYLWPAEGAPQTPMYAAFAIGQKWQSGVLLDTDAAGLVAKDKINKLCLSELAKEEENKFRVFMLDKAAGIKKNNAAIEDLFPDEFYIELVNEAYHTAITLKDLPEDGSDMITKRVEAVLKSKHIAQSLDKGRVVAVMLKRFDTWHDVKDLPKGTATKAEKLFKLINEAFSE